MHFVELTMPTTSHSKDKVSSSLDSSKCVIFDDLMITVTALDQLIIDIEIDLEEKTRIPIRFDIEEEEEEENLLVRDNWWRIYTNAIDHHWSVVMSMSIPMDNGSFHSMKSVLFESTISIDRCE